MTAKDKAKKELESLINYFKRNETALMQGDSNEEEIILHYISPMFKALGWDFNNEKRKDLNKLEVRAQRTFTSKSTHKDYRPDFNFNYNNGSVAFYLDAKAVPVKLKTHSKSALQVRGYGWNAGRPISVLTDFQELAVYNCTLEPKNTDSTQVGLVKYLNYEQYLDNQNFDFLWSYFQKDNVENKSVEQLVKSEGYLKGSITVDKHFLNSLNRWRELLALGIHRSNSNINEDTLNYLVQQTLDRLLFLRICEARNIENHQNLYTKIVSVNNAYDNLVEYYFEADKKYNSGLFDFTKDSISPKIQIDNLTLSSIVNELYAPFSPYRFDVIPVEIIGNAYEQFLGNEIRIERNKVIVEQKPEVRKAGGVYYTPQYIVNYIVEKTIGQLIKGKNPEQISKIKILDPSCGSGSFLLGAYQFLIDFHIDYYLKNKNKLKSIPVGEDGKLTTAEKKRILNNNIFGVDLDERAVEIAKLSLLLKVLEDETSETLADERLLGFKEKVLPNVDMNIKCGNSLIGSDFKKVTPSVSKAEIEHIKPFDWQIMFPQVFKQGGFDCVIGNPPYGAIFDEQSKVYLRHTFESFIGRGESYIVFIEKVLDLLTNSGIFGYIIPDTYLNLEFTRPIRNILLHSSKIKEVVVLPSNVFADATVDTTILIGEKVKKVTNFHKTDVSIKVFQKKEVLLNLNKPLKEFEISTQKWFETNSFNVGSSDVDINLIQKIDAQFPQLDTISEMFSGVKSYEVGKGNPPQTTKIRDEKPFTSDTRKNSKWLPIYDGKHIGRYEILWKSNNWIHYGKWLAAPRNAENFEDEKILIRKIIGKTLIANYVAETSYCNTLLFVLKLKKNITLNYRFVLGIINSNFIGWYFRKKFQIAEDDTFPQIMIRDILQFAFPTKPLKKQHDKLASLVDDMMQLKTEMAKAASTKAMERLETEFKYKDEAINSLVYELYGLSDNEIEIIENN